MEGSHVPDSALGTRRPNTTVRFLPCKNFLLRKEVDASIKHSTTRQDEHSENCTKCCRWGGYHPPRQPLKSSRKKQLYPTWHLLCMLARFQVPVPFPTAAVLTWLCLPSSPTSTLSGDALIFCFAEKIEMRHKHSQFSSFLTQNSHSSLPPGLMSQEEL